MGLEVLSLSPSSGTRVREARKLLMGAEIWSLRGKLAMNKDDSTQISSSSYFLSGIKQAAPNWRKRDY